MTLVEGEYIEQIEEIDEGWWSGVGPGGKTGLFPCMFCRVCCIWNGTFDLLRSQLRRACFHPGRPAERGGCATLAAAASACPSGKSSLCRLRPSFTN